MINKNEIAKLGRRSVTVIAVANIICVKPLGERLAVDAKASEKRIMTENFKAFVVRFISVYRFYFSSPPVKNNIANSLGNRLYNGNGNRVSRHLVKAAVTYSKRRNFVELLGRISLSTPALQRH